MEHHNASTENEVTHALRTHLRDRREGTTVHRGAHLVQETYLLEMLEDVSTILECLPDLNGDGVTDQEAARAAIRLFSRIRISLPRDLRQSKSGLVDFDTSDNEGMGQ